MLAIVTTGILWTIIDLVPGSWLRRHLRDIRAGRSWLVVQGIYCPFHSPMIAGMMDEGWRPVRASLWRTTRNRIRPH